MTGTQPIIRPFHACALAVLASFALAGCQVEVDPAPGVPAPPAPPAAAEVTVGVATAAPGTELPIEATGFTPGTEVQIGLGMPDSDYDVVAQETVDGTGRLATAIEVPDWTMSGHPYVVVVDAPGEARGVSDPFVVGQPGDRVSVPGTLTDEGVECPAMRDRAGTLYTLVGTDLEWGPGTDVHVEGRIAEAAICMQGTTLEVESIRRR
jgi:hypothetical protein